MNKTIYLLLSLFFVSSSLSAIGPSPCLDLTSFTSAWTDGNLSSLPWANHGLEQLNQTMESTLRLNSEQLKAIRKANRSFWKERQAIIEQPNKIARKTALLAAWDRWARELETVLDKYQYKAFLEWQYEVSPLSALPF